MKVSIRLQEEKRMQFNSIYICPLSGHPALRAQAVDFKLFTDDAVSMFLFFFFQILVKQTVRKIHDFPAVGADEHDGFFFTRFLQVKKRFPAIFGFADDAESAEQIQIVIDIPKAGLFSRQMRDMLPDFFGRQHLAAVFQKQSDQSLSLVGEPIAVRCQF